MAAARKVRPTRIAAGLYDYKGMEIRRGTRDIGDAGNGFTTKRGWQIRPQGGVYPGWLPNLCGVWRNSLLEAVRAIDAEEESETTRARDG